MRQPQNAKRGRGRGRRGSGNAQPNVPNRNTSYESNGPDVKLRGNAQQLNEKYLALAHDAAAAGERITAEAYTQFADHYFRLHQSAVGVAESKRQQDQVDTINSDSPKPSDANQANGIEMRAADSGGANSVSNDSKATAIKSNSDDGTKLSPAKLAEAVQLSLIHI